MLVAYIDVFSELDFYNLQFSIGQNSMFAAGFHFYGITGFYILNNTINYRASFPGNKIPYFIAEFVTVIIHLMTRIQCYFDCKTFFFHIKDTETAP